MDHDFPEIAPFPFHTLGDGSAQGRLFFDAPASKELRLVAENLLRLVASELFGRGVHVDDPVLEVDRDDPVVDVLDDQRLPPQLLLATKSCAPDLRFAPLPLQRLL